MKQFSTEFAEMVGARVTTGVGFEVQSEHCRGGKSDSYCRTLAQGGVCMMMQVLAELDGNGWYEIDEGRAKELLSEYFYARGGIGRVTPAAVPFCQARCNNKSDWELMREKLMTVANK